MISRIEEIKEIAIALMENGIDPFADDEDNKKEDSNVIDAQEDNDEEDNKKDDSNVIDIPEDNYDEVVIGHDFLKDWKRRSYEPYICCGSFLNDEREHGPWLVPDGREGKYSVFPKIARRAIYVDNNMCVLNSGPEDYKNEPITFEKLFKEYRWADGAVCGRPTPFRKLSIKGGDRFI